MGLAKTHDEHRFCSKIYEVKVELEEAILLSISRSCPYCQHKVNNMFFYIFKYCILNFINYNNPFFLIKYIY